MKASKRLRSAKSVLPAIVFKIPLSLPRTRRTVDAVFCIMQAS